MRLAIALTGLMALGAACALSDDLNFLTWTPPGKDDVRGPCPGLNTLANHHLLPHNGRNNTIPLLANVLGKAFNLSPELATIFASIGATTNPSGASSAAFDLDHLNAHNQIEHDASLSRADFYFTGADGMGKFDRETFDRFFAHFEGMEYITMEAAAAARYAQVRYSRENTPGFTYTTQQHVTSYAETAIYMNTMVDGTGGTRREFVRIFFEEERLPYREGWRPPRGQLHGLAIAHSILEEALATPETSVWCEKGERPKGQSTFDSPGCPFKF